MAGAIERKGISPFYPGQPVPVEFFVGRTSELDRVRRSVAQVMRGKPQAIYVEGEYGIGKTSFVRYGRKLVETLPPVPGARPLFDVHVMLNYAKSTEDAVRRTVEALVKDSGALGTRLKSLLAKYVGEQQPWGGVTIRFEALFRDSPDLVEHFLEFLGTIYDGVKDDYSGLWFTFDEINGLARDTEFAQLLKRLVDENALAERSARVPLLLMLCGTEQRRRDLIGAYQSVDRIFSVITVDRLSDGETSEFFQKAFDGVGFRVDEEALRYLVFYSGGQPKLMHVIGDETFWRVEGGHVTGDDALAAVVTSAREVGRKFIDPKVRSVLRTPGYKKWLMALAGTEGPIRRGEFVLGMEQDEVTRFDNFLQRLQRQEILVQGTQRGEWEFRDSLTWLYLRLLALKHERSGGAGPLTDDDEVDEAELHEEG